MGCQRAYVSQVLHGKAQFNLEQADRLNSFLEHSEDEAYFFLLQVELARAGTKSLQAAIQRQMQKQIDARLVLKNRLTNDRELTAEEKSQYYSAWYYGATRVAAGIPGLHSRKALADRLGLSLEKMQQVLEFLVRVQLMQQAGDRFEPTTHLSHLGNDSPLISKHHTNWRMRAIQALDSEGPRDLHYSSVVSLSLEDAQRVRALSVEHIENVMRIVRPSAEETMVSICLDLFEV